MSQLWKLDSGETPIDPEIILATHRSLAWYRDNRFDLLVNGDRIFPPMLAAINAAQETVNFLTYVYWTGTIAEAFADALAAAARRGVEVRVLLDAYGASRMQQGMKDLMTTAGCRLAWFHPVRFGALAKVNNRTHRKVLVVDGRTGFTGGVGIADEWTGDAEDPSHWRDNHFLVKGPIVHALQGAFAENWRAAIGEVLADTRLFPPLPACGSAAAVAIPGTPGLASDISLAYWVFLQAARHTIRIANPYFVPSDQILHAITQASARGVEVTILLPDEKNDSRLAHYASRSFHRRLVENGVELYCYKRTMMHTKLLTVDGQWSMIGSSNFDNRSFELNYEISVGVRDESLARNLEAVFDRDLGDAVPVPLKDINRRPWVFRARDAAIAKARRLL